MGTDSWSEWRVFPDPRQSGVLSAPFGAGCYELRHRSDGRLILFGSGSNCAYRMTSLLPYPEGCGHRRNNSKRQYVLQNLADVEYRTLACIDVKEAKECEANLRRNGSTYIFHT